MMIDKSASRLYVTDRLEQVRNVHLTKDQSHYLVRVMRRKIGDAVVVFNGLDGEWHTTITNAGKSSCTLLVDQQIRPQIIEPDIWLVFAPIKKARLDFLVEKATELGVANLQPVLSDHTDVGRINHDRLCANTIEAAEQCERLSIPVVMPLIALDVLLRNWPQNRRLLYLDETGQGEPLASMVNPGVKDAILVGPEGGFSPPELGSLRALSNATGVTLGPRILRAETAALVALACWQSFGGDTCVKRIR